MTGALRRLPYKAANMRRCWPDVTPDEQRRRLLDIWTQILDGLSLTLPNVSDVLPLPNPAARLGVLKRFEDQLDAVICATVGIAVLNGKARPFGDSVSAIWVPVSPTIT